MLKLLIVDDEVDITGFVKNFFKRRGLEVFSAQGGKQALELIEQEKPNLVLLDVNMMDMSGIQVLRTLRENGNDVPVVMVTGIDDEAVINEANSWGVKAYIHKPLVLEELEKVVMAELGPK